MLSPMILLKRLTNKFIVTILRIFVKSFVMVSSLQSFLNSKRAQEYIVFLNILVKKTFAFKIERYGQSVYQQNGQNHSTLL